jgi:hypothetical protein
MQTRVLFMGDHNAAVRLLGPAKSAKTDHADQFDLADVVRAGVAYRVVDPAGAHMAAFVLQPFGQALWITAAAGRAGMPLCTSIDDHATNMARQAGYRRLMFRTERAGLVARARRLGWHLVRQSGRSYYMNKDIT